MVDNKVEKMREVLRKIYRNKVDEWSDEQVKLMYSYYAGQIAEREKKRRNVWEDDGYKSMTVSKVVKYGKQYDKVELDVVIGRPIIRWYLGCPECKKKVEKNEFGNYECPKHGEVSPVKVYTIGVRVVQRVKGENYEIFLNFPPLFEEDEMYRRIKKELKEFSRVLFRGIVREYKGKKMVDVRDFKVIVKPFTEEEEEDSDVIEREVDSEEKEVKPKKKKLKKKSFKRKKVKKVREPEPEPEEEEEFENEEEFETEEGYVEQEVIEDEEVDDEEEEEVEFEIPSEYKSFLMKIARKQPMSAKMIKFICGGNEDLFNEILEYLEETDNGKYRLKKWVEEQLG